MLPTQSARARRSSRALLRVTSPNLPLALISFEIILAVFGPWVAPYSATRAVPSDALLAPSWDHLFGTNAYGADVFSRVLVAARVDLVIAVVSVGTAFVIGTCLGGVIGYYENWLTGVGLRFTEFVQSFPVFILAMALVAATGPRISSVIVVIAVLNVPIFLRLVRTEVLAMRRRSFIESARVTGNSDPSIILRHILPNTMGSSIAQASVSVGWALLLTAGLSFVGAGIQPPTAEWGLMISEGAQYMATGNWWMSLFPGLALGLAVLAFAYAGEMLVASRDVRRVVTASTVVQVGDEHGA